MYKRILIGTDGSPDARLAEAAALALACSSPGCRLAGCHVYAARLHRTRFEEMEPGLPPQYQEEERLDRLRGTHDDLISNGMQMISDAYLRSLAGEAEARGVAFEALTPEGRNYAELLRSMQGMPADLAILGAQGQGAVEESLLGSVTERVLLAPASADVMVVRAPWMAEGGPVIVGVDGSPESYAALARGVEIAGAFGAPLIAAAVYDPFFHTGVFRTIADALPEEQQRRFNFAAQEQLHDAIIDRGLEELYREGLARAEVYARGRGMAIETVVLKGKVYIELQRFAAAEQASLLVMGRWGLHRGCEAVIGANALNAARIGTGNVLIVAPPAEPVAVPAAARIAGELPLPWTPEAEMALEQVPSFARPMARRLIEATAREQGRSAVTPQEVAAAAALHGMGPPPSPDLPTTSAEAEVVVLRKRKLLAPGFHRHIARSRLLGTTVQEGDQVLVYDVTETVPDGPVRVTEQTRLDFR
ncbi:MAG: universal stress protein [Methanospirillum sp.]